MKKTLFLILLIIPFLLAACSKEESSLINLSEIELTDNQTLITGQVTARVGNDIELALGTIAQAQFNMGDMPSGEAGARPSGDRGAMPSGGRGNTSGGGSGSGSTSGGAMPADGNNTTQEAASNDTGDDVAAAATQIQLSGETMSLTIPVGTSVLVTSNGTLSASSFGRIQVDDILQFIVQTSADGSQTVIEAQIME